MKNKIILATVMLLSTLSTQAHAYCDYAEAYGLVMIATITSAPTGTTILLMGDNACRRDEILNVKEDAIAYGMTGETSPLLQVAIEQVQKSNPGLSADEIALGFMGAK